MLENSITKTSRVLADITIKLSDGSIADSTKASGKPSWLVMGDQSFSEAFEENLLDKQVGDEVIFELAACDAFGEPNPDQIHYMDLHQFPQDIELKEGAIVGFDQPNGQKIPGIIRRVEGSSVKVDFNHPLAGKKVVFEILIHQVKSVANEVVNS